MEAWNVVLLRKWKTNDCWAKNFPTNLARSILVSKEGNGDRLSKRQTIKHVQPQISRTFLCLHISYKTVVSDIIYETK